MDKFSVVLTIIASFLILCQWFVYVSSRKYVFQRYGAITRKTAYITLALLGVINVIAVRLLFSSDTLAPDTFAKQFASVAYFSFLGYVLLLSVLFLFLGATSQLLSLKDLVARALGTERAEAEGAQGEESRSTAVDRGSGAEYDLRRQASRRMEAFCSQPEEPRPVKEETSGRSGAPPPPSRRAFLKWSAAAGMVVAATAAGEGIAQGYRRPVVESFNFFHDSLDGATRPITVIQITDFHFGLFMGSGELDFLVESVNAIEADALFLTGDIFHSPMTPVELAIPILKKFKPRRFGNFVVMGNHDFYAGETRSVESFKQGGLTLLRDQWITFRDGNREIHVGGIDDPMSNWLWGTEFPKFKRFMKISPQGGGIKILLSHRPAIFPRAARAGIDLVLAGHIHGGQIILPTPGTDRGVSLANLVSEYTHGWYERGASRMYLNRGVGLTFVPWRLNCPPEIAVFHLKPTEGREASGTAARII
jgi:predicted MPP superfamily phosphohydrolase